MNPTTTQEPLQGLRRHKLMPNDIRAALPPIGSQDGKGLDATVYLKLFSPYGRYTFYVTEYDGNDLLYGYVLSPLEPDFDEFGYASLREAQTATVYGRVPAIERDKGFGPVRLGDCDGVAK